MRKRIGSFSERVIKTLNLDIPVGTPIYIADSNIEHMKSSHPSDYEKYKDQLPNIIANPDYVGKNIKDNSIEFTKEYFYNGEYVKVAIRVSSSNIYYARSMYVLNNNRVKNFIAKGTLKKLDS